MTDIERIARDIVDRITDEAFSYYGVPGGDFEEHEARRVIAEELEELLSVPPPGKPDPPCLQVNDNAD